MRIFLIATLILFIFALIVATGTTFVTSWNVWLCAGLVSFIIDQISPNRLTIK